jgi:DHA1 family bicyclomycin/chloramphenicol resistance-like MFS transporter
MRILQGIGAGGPSSMCLAICRDRYEGNQRKKVLATVSILLTLAPMLSPSIGTLLLTWFQWQTILITQCCFGIILIALSLPQTESAAQLIDTAFWKLLGRYRKLAGNHNYVRSTLALGTLIGPYLGYVAAAPLIYIDYFNLDKFWFSMLFAINALLYMTGAFLSTHLSKRFGDNHLLTLCILGTLLGGIGIALIGHTSPWAFALCMGLITGSFGMTRPISQHIILEQVHTDVGAASSMLVFYQFIIGATCMTIASLPWPSRTAAFGIMAVCIAVLVFALWVRLQHQLPQHAQTD